MTPLLPGTRILTRYLHVLVEEVGVAWARLAFLDAEGLPLALRPVTVRRRDADVLLGEDFGGGNLDAPLSLP